MYFLDGKVALIIGTANKKGMGHCIAIRLAQEGAVVVVSDLADHSEGLDGLVNEIKRKGGEAMAVAADATVEQQVNDMVEKVLAKFRKIDILVNAVGIGLPHLNHVINTLEKDWRKMLDINLTAVFLCCKAVAKDMVRRNEGGKIINFSSIIGKKGAAGGAAYSTSKFGIIGLTQSLALELAPYKINVNAVCPTNVPTGFVLGKEMANLSEREGISWEEAADILFADFKKGIPLGRLGTVEDVANMVLFLASSQSDFITGQAININGGELMQ